VRELSGIGKNRQRSLAALGGADVGHVANCRRDAQAEVGIWASNSGSSPTASGTNRCCSR